MGVYLFERSNIDFSTDGGEVVKKLCQRVTAFDVVNEAPAPERACQQTPGCRPGCRGQSERLMIPSWDRAFQATRALSLAGGALPEEQM
jgi:hypothetical protein